MGSESSARVKPTLALDSDPGILTPVLQVLATLLLTLSPALAADTVMSLNIYGYKTMPHQAGDFAALVEKHGVDVLAIQEGVDDWNINMDWPEDYSRSEVMHQALGDCWDRQYQVYVNHCRGFSIEQHKRFDLADGPNATRTGEKAVIRGPLGRFMLLNLHWDHESESARQASAAQTADAIADVEGVPVVVLGDFNSRCSGSTVQSMVNAAKLETAVDGGIDCIFLRGLEGSGEVVDASPSDHPAVLIRLEAIETPASTGDGG